MSGLLSGGLGSQNALADLLYGMSQRPRVFISYHHGGDQIYYDDLSKTFADKTTEIARIADEKDKRVAEYEKQLGELSKKYEALRDQVHSLLPEATGVGLAKSFHSRKRALTVPIVIYFLIFLLSVFGFIVFGWYGLFVEKISTLEQFFKYLLERSPIIVGLILMEEFSRRQYAATAKLREDYAYKETISIAFDGYKKAMLDAQSSPADSLTSIFSKSVIETLHERPGRLLEREEKHILPLVEFFDKSFGGADKDEKGKLAEAFSSAKSAVQGLWLKGASIILVVLLVGAGIGYYFAGKKTEVSVGPQPEPSVAAKK